MKTDKLTTQTEATSEPVMGESYQQLGKLTGNLKLPIIVAPMFLVSGPELVIASCRAGLVGTFPAPNARTINDLQDWLETISEECQPNKWPWAMNLIVHSSNDRVKQELELVQQYQPPLVISVLGSPARVVDTVHDYGGLVFADVSTVPFARKAAAAGVDGLILVCAGAGGHTGQYSPFAFVREVRSFWDGPVVLAGAIADARSTLAAQVLGVDLVYMGTRFISAKESLVSNDYRQMLVDARMEDIITSSAVTGVNANWLRASLRLAGFDDEALSAGRPVDFSSDRMSDLKAWKNVWSAGQGVSATDKVLSVSDIVDELVDEYSVLVNAEMEKGTAVSFYKELNARQN